MSEEHINTVDMFDADFVMVSNLIAMELGSKVPPNMCNALYFLNILRMIYRNKCNDGCLSLNAFSCPKLDMTEPRREALDKAAEKLCKSQCFPGAQPMVIVAPDMMTNANAVAANMVATTAHNQVMPGYYNTNHTYATPVQVQPSYYTAVPAFPLVSPAGGVFSGMGGISMGAY
jgi:hypothetical protein